MSTDQFATYDAAYLLGALSPQDRAEYEAHLADCQPCRSAVNQLAGIPGLLASVSPEDAARAGEPGPEVPDTLLPRLMAEVQRTRFRRRWTTGLVGVAAAAVAAIALVVVIHGSSPNGSSTAVQNPSVVLQMTSVAPNVPIRATAQLSDKEWGTRIVMHCVYGRPTGSGGGIGAGGQYTGRPITYTMVVKDTSGRTQQIAAWKAWPGKPVVVDGSTSVPRSEIASLQVRGPSDIPVLQLQL